MEAQLNQAGTFAAQNYAESFFRHLPTDSRSEKKIDSYFYL